MKKYKVTEEFYDRCRTHSVGQTIDLSDEDAKRLEGKIEIVKEPVKEQEKEMIPAQDKMFKRGENK